MYKKNIVTFCCFFIISFLILSSIVIAKENKGGKPDLCDKFEDKKDKWEYKWLEKEEEDKDWGEKWEEKREKKIDKLDVLKDKFCDECNDGDDNDSDDNNDDNGDDNGDNDNNGGNSNNIRTSSSTNIINIPPIADTSAGEPYIGFINENIELNASSSYDPDGYIVEFIWEFNDGTVKEGEIITHSFDEKGDYGVILTVKDNRGAINSTKTKVSVVQPNNPPTKPIINGTLLGEVNILYDFTILSYDLDGDNIRYFVDWGDESKINSQFVENGTEMIFQYSWNKSGSYTISVKTFDGYAFSETNEIIIDIGVSKSSMINEFLLLILIVILLISILILLSNREKEKPKKL